MKKSGLSMTSIVSGITATIFGVLMFPLSLVPTKTPNGFALLGFIGFIVFGAGLLGIITSSVKLMTTNSITEEDINNRSIAWKGFWFSISPVSFWMLLALIGSIAK